MGYYGYAPLFLVGPFVMRQILFSIAILFFSFILPSFVEAVEYTSTNFVVKDSVIGSIGGSGSSSSFNMFSSGEFIVTGRSTTASFIGRFGFLYFPFVTNATLSGTAGDTVANLSWTATSSGLGFSVSGYEVGQSTTSGGPYVFTNVGNVLNSIRTSLANGTTYYFVVRTLDTFGNPIITSNEISITPVGGVTPPGGGSGGGSVVPPKPTGVQFLGYAYPHATVTFLKNGVERAKTKADATGAFNVLLEELFDQTVLYTLYAQDQDGHRSLLLNYPYTIVRGVSAVISGVRFAPTIIADKISVKQGNTITFSGFALPAVPVELLFRGHLLDRALTTQSQTTGRYQLPFSTTGIRKETYQTRAHYIDDQRVSTALEFTVGDADIFRNPSQNILPGDCNVDRVIDLRDFSILAFWYQKPNPPACIDTNSDGTINLTDFSILAFYWSG